MGKKKGNQKAQKHKQKKKSPKKRSPDSAICHLLNDQNDQEMYVHRLIGKLMRKHSQKKLLDALQNLLDREVVSVDDEEIVKLLKPLPTKTNIIEGRVDMAQSRVAYIISESSIDDVFIAKKDTNKALHGDTVKVQLKDKKGKPEGIIIEIVKRLKDKFIGTLQVEENYAFLLPDSNRMPYDIFIPIKDLNGGKNGDKAIVQMTSWMPKAKNPNGKVLEILGSVGSNDVEMKSILIDNGFNIAFPNEVLNEVASIPDEIPKKVIDERLDYRDVTTFTIDPDDAKDFDDALSIKELGNGNLEIGVHIADVSHYVKRDSELDREAYARATSVYLPDRVCPMFPERLSNIICSLRPEEDKLCFSVLFEFDANLNITDYTFARTVIHSNKRFTYNEAQEAMDTGKEKFSKELKTMEGIAQKLRKERFEKGSINFETKEVRFRLDDKGFPIDVFVKERKEVHLLIEDFMLLANKTVARYVSKLKVKAKERPFVYRVHDTPDIGKLEKFAEIAKQFGYKVKFEDNAEQISGTLNDVLTKVKGKPEEVVLSRMAIRAMAKAIYTTKNVGHYGLGFEYYGHFTSPIRRYPDVLVHRVLEEAMTERDNKIHKSELEEMCKHTSLMERQAQTAEREAIKYKQVEYLSNKIGEEFNGMISGVISSGIFVELEGNFCEGFVYGQYLGDQMSYDESKVCITNLDTNERYQFGDKIRVKVLRVNLKDKKIDLEPVW